MGGKGRTGYSTELPHANIYTVPCPIIHALNLIGGKWKLPVLWHLFDAESVRYNELKRSVVGITNIMLTQCLRELEAAGLVRRDDFGEVPPRVEYSLTGPGIAPGAARTVQMGREAACPHRRGRSAFGLSRYRRILTHCQPVLSGPYSSMPFFRPDSATLQRPLRAARFRIVPRPDARLYKSSRRWGVEFGEREEALLLNGFSFRSPDSSSPSFPHPKRFSYEKTSPPARVFC